MEGPDKERWTLRVLVLQPRGVAALPGLALAAAVFSIVIAASWHGTAWLAGAVLAALSLAAGLSHRSRLSPSPSVSALRATAAGGRWQARLPDGWRDAVLVSQHRGPAWLSLTLRPMSRVKMAVTVKERQVTCTVWQVMLPPDCWRRLCCLAGAARRECRPLRRREAV